MSAKHASLDESRRGTGSRVTRACIAAVLGVALGLAHGCTSPGSLGREYLDRQTGATVSTAAAALVFARTDARYSRSGRDYLYLGPVSLNHQGLREYYVWVGLGTTLDRGYLAPERPVPSKLHVVVGDELMELALRPWETIAATSRGATYRTSVTVDTALGARVTLDQLELLSTVAIESIFVSHAAGQHIYSSWVPGDWSEFLRREAAARVARESRR